MSDQIFRSTGLFDHQENELTSELFKSHGSEFVLILQLLELFNEHLDRLSGTVRIEERISVTILNFMGQNLKFLNKAYLELTKGYIRIPSSLLKIVTEQLFFSLIFAEFPEIEQEYHDLGNYKFSRKYPKNKLLSKIGDDGVLFKIKDKPDFWNDVIEKEMLSQMNEISHPNPDYVFGVMFDEKTQQFSKGPRLHDEKLVKGMIRIILLAIVFSVVVIDSYFKIDREEKNSDLLNKATRIINNELSQKSLK